MDPKACLREAFEALNDRDYELASDRLEDYRAWRTIRGCEPFAGADDAAARCRHALFLRGFPAD